MFKGEFEIGGVAAVVEGGAGLFDFFVRGMGVIGVIEEEEVWYFPVVEVYSWRDI